MRSTHCPSIIDPIYTVLLCLLFVLLILMAYGHAQHLTSSLCYLIIAISISHLSLDWCSESRLTNARVAGHRFESVRVCFL
jgi:hypothetical protein